MGRWLEPRSSRPAWATWQKLHLYKKYKKLAECSGAPVDPTTREAEVGGPPEPGEAEAAVS